MQLIIIELLNLNYFFLIILIILIFLINLIILIIFIILTFLSILFILIILIILYRLSLDPLENCCASPMTVSYLLLVKMQPPTFWDVIGELRRDRLTPLMFKLVTQPFLYWMKLIQYSFKVSQDAVEWFVQQRLEWFFNASWNAGHCSNEGSQSNFCYYVYPHLLMIFRQLAKPETLLSLFFLLINLFIKGSKHKIFKNDT